MIIKEITEDVFTSFVNKNQLKSYMQTIEYAKLNSADSKGYNLIGLFNENNVLIGATMILFKKIGFSSLYGYAPKGFLINYYDENIVNTFNELIKSYYSKKNIVFIKINPEIIVGTINPKTIEFVENKNMVLKNKFEDLGYRKLKDNLYFESLNPRFNAYIDLKNHNFDNYFKSHRNKVRKSKTKGLYLIKGKFDDIKTIYEFFPKNKSLEYYQNMYNLYSNKDCIDVMLVRVDYQTFIRNSQSKYDEELAKNTLYNEILHRSHNKSDLNRKMESDAVLCILRNEIVLATEGLKNNNNEIVAGAIVIKDGARVQIIVSGFNKDKKYNQNYFMIDALINYYKNSYYYLDIGAICGDFNKTSPYYNFNRFKYGFIPNIYEFIGEYDLVINKNKYTFYLNSGKLQNEFKKQSF